jgi:hypothetical protein
VDLPIKNGDLAHSYVKNGGYIIWLVVAANPSEN